MKHNERMVWFYDINMKANARGMAQPHLISTEQAFRYLASVPEEHRIKAYHGNHYYIQHISEVNGLFKILLNKSDHGIADPTFVAPDSRARRKFNKNEGEGQEFSCHIIVKPSSAPLRPALALIEQSFGIPPLMIQRFFNYLIRTANRLCPEEFTYHHPDGSVDSKGNPKTYRAWYSFDFSGHPSDEFIADIQNGMLHGIELITERNYRQPWDQHGYIQETAKVVRLKPANLSRAGNIINVIRSVFTSGQQANYEKARVKFKTNHGLDRTVILNTQTMGITQNDLYVKKIKISDFDGRLESAYESPCGQIVTKMINLLG